MKYLRHFAIAMIPAIAACSQTAKQDKETDGGQEITAVEILKNRLNTLTEQKLIAFGHHDDPVYGHFWVGDSGRSDIKEITGDYPAVMSWDLGGLELGDSMNLDGVSFERMRNEVIAQDARGGINTFSWHLRNPVNGADSWAIDDTTIVSQMIHSPEFNAKYLAQVRNVAKFFNSLTDKNGEKIPVIFRPWHEQSGSWFWWGADLCSPEDYKSLWRQMRHEMDSLGTDNVVWAFSPDRIADEKQYLERYPGDEYVDIMGVDVYHFGGENGLERYLTDASRSLGIVRKLASEHNKLTAFTETGSEGIPMADWWTNVLLPLLKENPVSYVVVWRNAHDKPGHFYAPFKEHPSAQSFMEFYNDSTTVFAKQLAR